MRELKQNVEQGSCLEAIFDLEGTDLKYSTAGNLAIFPENPSDYVECVAKRLGFNLDEQFVFIQNVDSVKKAKKHPFPTPCSIRDALTKFVDIKGTLKGRTIQDLSSFADDEQDKKDML